MERCIRKCEIIIFPICGGVFNVLQNFSILGYDTCDNRCYEYGLNMKKWNTDHDGINDGDELQYWNVTRGLSLNESIAYCKNPDFDNDSILHGGE